MAFVILHLGETVDSYLADHPHLTAAQIYDALSYFFDHRTEIEREIEESKAQNAAAESGMVADERGIWRFPKTVSG